jgi:hypothetical protein
VPGNHENWGVLSKLTPDDDGFLRLTDRLWYAPGGLRVRVGERTIGFLGGARSVDWPYRTEGKDWWEHLEEVREADVETLGTDRLDVLISHEAPTGVDLEGTFDLSADELARANRSRDLVRLAAERAQVELLLHGHWHQRRTHELSLSGATCRVESLGCDGMPGEDAVLLDLDTLAVRPLPRRDW